MPSIGRVSIGIFANVRNALIGLKTMSVASVGLTGKMGKLNKTLALTGKGMGILTVASTLLAAGLIKNSAEFEDLAVKSTVFFGDAVKGSKNYFKWIEKVKVASRDFNVGTEDAFAAVQKLGTSGKRGAEAMAIFENAVKLSALSGLDLDQVVTRLIGVFNIFRVPVEEMGTVTAKLVKTYTSADQTFQDLVDAVKLGAPIFAVTTGKLDDFLVSTVAMADQMFKASSAGTLMRRVLLNLTAGTPKIRRRLDELGLSFFKDTEESLKLQKQLQGLKTKMDAFKAGKTDLGGKEVKQLKTQIDATATAILASTGGLKDFVGFIDELQTRLGKLSEQQRNIAEFDIFGLRGKLGSVGLTRGIERMTKTMKDLQEVDESLLDDLTEARLDTFKSEFGKLVKTIRISMAEIFLPALPAFQARIKKMTDRVKAAADGMSENTKKAIANTAVGIPAVLVGAMSIGALRKIPGALKRLFSFAFGKGGVGQVISKGVETQVAAGATSGIVDQFGRTITKEAPKSGRKFAVLFGSSLAKVFGKGLLTKSFIGLGLLAGVATLGFAKQAFDAKKAAEESKENFISVVRSFGTISEKMANIKAALSLSDEGILDPANLDEINLKIQEVNRGFLATKQIIMASNENLLKIPQNIADANVKLKETLKTLRDQQKTVSEGGAAFGLKIPNFVTEAANKARGLTSLGKKKRGTKETPLDFFAFRGRFGLGEVETPETLKQLGPAAKKELEKRFSQVETSTETLRIFDQSLGTFIKTMVGKPLEQEKKFNQILQDVIGTITDIETRARKAAAARGAARGEETALDTFADLLLGQIVGEGKFAQLPKTQETMNKAIEIGALITQNLTASEVFASRALATAVLQKDVTERQSTRILSMALELDGVVNALKGLLNKNKINVRSEATERRNVHIPGSFHSL